VNYDNSLVVTITVTCYSWAPSSGDHLFTCGAIYRPPQLETLFNKKSHLQCKIHPQNKKATPQSWPIKRKNNGFTPTFTTFRTTHEHIFCVWDFIKIPYLSKFRATLFGI